MFSIIGDALFTASRQKPTELDRRVNWADRFVPSHERLDGNRRINTRRDLFWS